MMAIARDRPPRYGKIKLTMANAGDRPPRYGEQSRPGGRAYGIASRPGGRAYREGIDI